MFFDRFRPPLPEDFYQGACDIHSHLLPGVDDGFPDFQQTMDGLFMMSRVGFKKVKITPHFMKDYPENTRANIESKYKAFLAEAGETLPVEITLGGEYMLDSCFMDRCEEGFLTLDSSGSMVLCETSYMRPDPKAKDMLYQVMLKGYQPVIAHPERYNYASMAMYKRWKEKDYMLQLNLLSLAGSYGDTAKTKARKMLAEGMYDYVGSDLHRVANNQKLFFSLRLSKKEKDHLLILLEKNKEL